MGGSDAVLALTGAVPPCANLIGAIEVFAGAGQVGHRSVDDQLDRGAEPG